MRVSRITRQSTTDTPSRSIVSQAVLDYFVCHGLVRKVHSAVWEATVQNSNLVCVENAFKVLHSVNL